MIEYLKSFSFAYALLVAILTAILVFVFIGAYIVLDSKFLWDVQLMWMWLAIPGAAYLAYLMENPE